MSICNDAANSAGLLGIALDLLVSPARFAFHAYTRTAICADLHLGFESSLAALGTPMPEFTSTALRTAWAAMLAEGPRHIVIAGDLFHTDSPGESTCDFARGLLKCPVPLTIVPGNHDPSAAKLAAIFPHAQIAAVAHAGRYAIYHGHTLPPSARAVGHSPMIVGHQHPSVILGDRVQSAKMPCFAMIQTKSREPILLLPAFSTAPLGSNLLTVRHWILDFPAPKPADVRIAGIVKDRVLNFGPLSQLPVP